MTPVFADSQFLIALFNIGTNGTSEPLQSWRASFIRS
jgi:hypothetical protein